MEEYRGNRYLDQQPNRYLNQQQNDSSVSRYLTIGAVLVGGAIGLRYYRDFHPAMTRFRRNTIVPLFENLVETTAGLEQRLNTIRTFLGGIHYALDGKNELYHLRNPGRFNERFQRYVAQSLKFEERRKQTILGGIATAIEDRTHNFLSTARNIRNQVFYEYRRDKIIRELYERMPDQMENGLHNILNQIRSESFFSNPSVGKIEGLIARYSPEEASKRGYQHSLRFENEIERKKFIATLFDVLKKYESRDSIGIDPKELNTITKNRLSDVYEGAIRDHQERQRFISSVLKMGEWRPAKLKDLVDLMDKDSVRIPTKKGSHRDLNVARFYRMAMSKDERIGDLIADPNIFINHKGEILDLRFLLSYGDQFLTPLFSYTDKFLRGFREHIQIPFLRFNPIDLLMHSTFQGIKDAPPTYVLKRGTIHPYLVNAETLSHPFAHNQDAVVGPLAKSYLYTSGKVIDILTGEVIQDNTYIASARFGPIPRMAAGMANLHRRDLSNRGFLARLFDLFGQEGESKLQEVLSIFTKFDNPDWERNELKALLDDGVDFDKAEKAYKNLYQKIADRTTPLSDDVAEYLNQWIKEAYGNIGIDLTKLESKHQIMDALGKIRRAIGQRDSGVVPVSNKISDDIEGLHREIKNTWRQYYQDPHAFLKNKRLRTEDTIDIVDFTLGSRESTLVNKVEDVKRLVHQHALKQLDYYLKTSGSKRTVTDLIKEGIEKGVLTDDALKQVRNLDVLTTMRQWWHDIYMDPRYKPNALNEFVSRVRDESDPFSHALRESIEEMTPWWGVGPGLPPPQYQGFTEYTVMNKARGARWALENYNKLVSEGVNPLKAGVKSAFEVLRQPFAGRNSLGSVTTVTLPFYVFAERLDNALSQAGLGLSQLHRGSMQSILFNQFFRRVVLPYMVYEQLKYFDGLFGDFFSDKLADTYVNMHLDVARAKEELGINRIGRQLSQVLVGFDQIAEWWPVKLFNFLTFGMFSDWRSEEELRHYYESGEDPVRKGRYWSIGSGTSWMGGKIDRYIPNWYRRLKSDYEFTDTMYGSEDEYWANHWMPTLTHPFAPIRHFLLDPYHWEKKHAKDRPYPVTGGFPELQQIPIIGPLLDNTIGRILKPHREHPDLEKAHRQYLEEINRYIASQYEANTTDLEMRGMPAGGYELVKDTGGFSLDLSDEEGAIAVSDSSGEEGAIAVSGDGKGSNAKGIVRRQLAYINQKYVKAASGGKKVDPLELLNDPEFVADIDDAGRIDSLSGIGKDIFYSFTELAGIYGFGIKALLGVEESNRDALLEPSSRMTSYSRAFWDLELGGLGGTLSEIFRRYVPRDPNKNYYNPIRNTMPEWLPSFDYWINFQYGDPYTKIPQGEMRLPGAAYERLYKLHPDIMGKYGVFDRFRILADVAPKSEEYKKYRKLVSLMNQQGLLTEDMKQEYREILEQVRMKNKKYQFYPRRFGNAKLIYKNVTITKVLDANTFLTEEFPYNPIKLAGIHIKSDDKDAQEFLSQFIYEGAKVRIGIDADPLHRVRDDSMNTIRAVVYAGDDGLNPLFSVQGQNLNYMVANRQFGNMMGFGGKNKVSIHDDGSATSTVALFGDNTVKLGAFWEKLTHDILPNLPVLGPVVDKFLQVRSPLEMYKRVEVYGKAWRPWDDPKSWILPMFETLAEKNPILAAAQGAGIGWLFGRSRIGKYYGIRIGAIIGGALSTLRVFREQLNELRFDGDEYNDTWIPDRRRKEREINEYFDKLKYIKYKALFEAVNKEAIRREGINVKKFIEENLERGKKNKNRKKKLEKTKKWLNIDRKIGYGDGELIKEKLSDVRSELKDIEEDRPVYKLGPYSMLALRYYDEYTSTLYGANPYGDMKKIFKALPAKDREFFADFLKASPEEREEILRLVPKDQRRFYQAKWGLELDKKESLESFFSRHYLPDANWEGWRPDVSLDDIKVKVIKNEGLELTEFGYWDDDEKRANMSKAKPIDIHQKSLSSRLDMNRLEEALRSTGLVDVKVTMTTTYGKEDNKIDLMFDLIKDRTKEVLRELNLNLDTIFG